MAHPIKAWLGILRERVGVLGKVFIAFWKRCGHREPSDVELRSSARAAPLEATRGAPMAVHSLFHAFFILSTHVSNRYLLRALREPLQGHQQSEIYLVHIKVMTASKWVLRRRTLGLCQARGGRGQEVDIQERNSSSPGRCVQLDCGISELEAVSKIVLSLSLYKYENWNLERRIKMKNKNRGVLIICQALFYFVVVFSLW